MFASKMGFVYRLVFVLIFAASGAASAGVSHCKSVSQQRGGYGKNFNYCVDYISSQVDHSKVIYFFHGIFGSEKTWFQSRQFNLVRQYLLQSGLPTPPVVSISFGSTWLVNRYVPHNPHSGLSDQIIQQVFPYIEHNVLGVSNPTRLGFGTSMGGFNLTQLHIYSPWHFSKIALTCPAMALQSPYSSFREIRNFVTRNRARPLYVRKALAVSKKYFPSATDWNLYSPLEHLRRYSLPTSSTRFYISAVTNDEFGFREGDRYLAGRLQSSGYTVQWETVRGDHCDINPFAVANFLRTP